MLPVNGSDLRRDRRRGGELVEVLSKTDFSFDGRDSGSDQVVPLAVGIDTSGWKSGVLAVRLHAIGTWSASATAIIEPYNVSLVPEDPSIVYTGALLTGPGGVGTAEVRIINTIAAGALVMKEFGSAVGHQLMVRLVWNQGPTPAVGAQTFSISCDLVGRYQ